MILKGAELALGVDIGSHGVRCVLLEPGRIEPRAIAVSRFGPPLPPARRTPAEWWEALVACVRFFEAPLRAAIRTIGITGVRGSVVGLDRQGSTVTPWGAQTRLAPRPLLCDAPCAMSG